MSDFNLRVLFNIGMCNLIGSLICLDLIFVGLFVFRLLIKGNEDFV